MVTRESWLMQHCHCCTIMVATSTCCSLSCSNSSMERARQSDACLIFFVSVVATPKVHQYFLILETPSSELVYAKDTWRLWANVIGCFCHLSPVRLTSASNRDNCWHPSDTAQMQIGPLLPWWHYGTVCTKALYTCGSDVPGHQIHTFHETLLSPSSA